MNYIHWLYFDLTTDEVKFMQTSNDTTRTHEFYSILDKSVYHLNKYVNTEMYIILKTEILRFINTYLGRYLISTDKIFRKSVFDDIKYYRNTIPYDCYNDMNIFEFSKELDYIYNIYLDIKDYNNYKPYYNE
jgi:hypothetical protein